MDARYKDIGSPLTKVVEECAEVIHIACKIDRFGWFNYHPDDKNKTTNIEILRRELNDLYNVMGELEKHMIDIKHKKTEELTYEGRDNNALNEM